MRRLLKFPRQCKHASPKAGPHTFYCLRERGHEGFHGYDESAVVDLAIALREIRSLKAKLAARRRSGGTR